MPKTRDYKGKKSSAVGKTAKRRPGRDEALEYVDTLEAEPFTEDTKAPIGDEEVTEQIDVEASEQIADELPPPEMDETDKLHDNEEKVRIEFFGSELLRGKAPEVFAAAESIANEWKKDGTFENIEIPNPILKQATTLGLQRAKQVEKKLEEKGVFLVAKMGIEMVKSKLKK